MKTKEKLEARRLRAENQLSLCEIAARLGVSKGSVSLWVRDLPLSQPEIKKRKMIGWTVAGKTRTKNAKAVRMQYQRNGYQLAITKRNNPLFVAGCMAYWAEGAKNRNTASICNIDPYFLRLWMRFMRQFFDVKESDFRIQIRCYLNNGLRQDQIESYWLEQLSIPKNCLNKTLIVKKHPMSSGAKKNRHPYGVVRINVNSTEIVQQIFGGIKFIAQINDEHRWLY